MESESIKQKQRSSLSQPKIKNIKYDEDLKKWELKPKNKVINPDIIPIIQNKNKIEINVFTFKKIIFKLF